VSSVQFQPQADPLVSVIIPTRDRLELLQRAVASARAQSERRIEVIIVDDASTDGTPAYVASLPALDARIRVVRNASPVGGGGARNAGVERSRGSWVAFLDDDDEWMPRKLERQLQAIEAEPTAVACSCGYLIRSGARRSRAITARASVTLQQLLTDNFLGGASMCLCSAAAFKAIGGFDPELKSAQDLDLWLRLRQRGSIASCAEPLVVHHAHAGARITSNLRSRYLGVRRFLFKHRGLMDVSTRRHWASYCCYLMSMQDTRSPRRRLRLLTTSLRSASFRYALSFAKASVPRLLSDTWRGASGARTARAPADG
jgi:glycosyltransferase involved in cell wall biosynthesis